MRKTIVALSGGKRNKYVPLSRNYLVCLFSLWRKSGSRCILSGACIKHVVTKFIIYIKVEFLFSYQKSANRKQSFISLTQIYKLNSKYELNIHLILINSTSSPHLFLQTTVPCQLTVNKKYSPMAHSSLKMLNVTRIKPPTHVLPRMLKAIPLVVPSKFKLWVSFSMFQLPGHIA